MQHVALIITLLFLEACSISYTPDRSRPFEPIPEFSSNAAISLKNGQPSTEEVAVARHWYGNLKKCTDVAIEIAAREMKKRGVKIEDNGPKTITMSIQSAHLEAGFTTIETQIAMHVTTSDGYSADYVGQNHSVMAANPERQFDGALMRVVREMLLDPRMIKFVTSQ